MNETVQKETHGFQTEVKQLMHLVVHSLYSNKEIFLRELISNASDAADKLRFAALDSNELYENDADLSIQIEFDKDARTITIRDNGIGMSRDETIDHLGTIARSGTKEFLARMTGDQSRDSQLIGQFGVGFYSVFIVADHVTVNTRKAGLPADQAVSWQSRGDGEFTLEAINKPERGTEIILHLKEDEDEFLDDWRLRSIIRKYADHISIPVQMRKTPEPEYDDEGKPKPVDDSVVQPFEAVNKAKALWTRSKSDISEEEYQEFYKHVSHDFEPALTWSHNKVEGKLEYTSLLYIPQKAPFDYAQRDKPRGLKLYVQRVFIMDEAEQFLPTYMRFVQGVVDSNDLPLNVSREILQSNRVVETIRGALVKRVLNMLETLAERDKEKYAGFWQAFGKTLKEGPAEDFANREQIAKLLRFASTHNDTEEQTVSFEDYIARMKPEQDKIYYITADTFAAAKNSPHLEIFRKKGVEVLLLSEHIDEWLVSHLTDFDGKQLQSVARGELDLKGVETDQEKEALAEANKTFESVIKQVKELLDEHVKDVRLTDRLTNSPACLVADENDLGGNLQRILQAAGQNMPMSKPILELNPDHTLIKRLQSETDEAKFSDWAHILFDQALLAEGGQLEDPASFVKRLNEMLLDVSA